MSTTAAFAFPMLSIVQPPRGGRGDGVSGVRGGRGGRPAGATSSTASAIDKAALARPDESATDAVLVARAVSGNDHDAYAALVRRHQSAVRKLLRRLTRNDHALADDLAQETFIQVHRNLRQFRGDARFATWIYRIAYNAFLADVRSRHDTEPLGDDFGDFGDFGYVGDLGSGAPALERTTALRLDLERALDRLPAAERDALVHCYYLDLSHEEAAYVLQCPLGTVKTHVLRGKQKLKAMLSAWAPPGAPLDEGPIR